MTVDEIVRAWRDADAHRTLAPDARAAILNSPLQTMTTLDRELGPGRIDWRAESTCTAGCGDTCPEPSGTCAYTCQSGSLCCC